MFQENYWNRITNNPNSPIAKFLIYPSLKLLYYSNNNYYYFINDFPFIRIVVKNVENRKKFKVKINCGICFEKLPNIFISKNKFPEFISTNIKDFSF
jgi:hypothetical protein